METVIVIFIIGLFASFVGSFISGTLSLVSVPLMMAFGLPPVTAFGALKVGTLGFDIGGLIRYFQEQKIDWGLFIPLTITSIAGYALGGYLLLNINTELITRIVGFIILFCVPVMLWGRKLGIEQFEVSSKRRWFGHVASFFVYLYAGSFAIGVGIFMSLKQMYFYGLPLIEAKATSKLPTIIGSLGGVIVFCLYGAIVWSYAIALLCGMFFGSYLGVKYAIKSGNQNLKWLLLLSMSFFGVKFAFGL